MYVWTQVIIETYENTDLGAEHMHRQTYENTHEKSDVYFYSSGAPSLHECITQHTDGAAEYVCECV